MIKSKYFRTVLIFLASAVFFYGCFFNMEDETEALVPASTGHYTVPTTSGKDVYAVMFNPTKTALKNIRQVTGATGLSDFNAVPKHDEVRSASPNFSNVIDFSRVELPQKIHFHPKDDIAEILKAKKNARFISPNINSRESPPKPVTPIDETVGAKTTLYIDKSIDISSGKTEYESASATLKYIGKKCYVWLVDKDSVALTDEQCKEVGISFDEYYELVRNVFGAESDELVPQYGNLLEMNTNNGSKTGTKVNIVLYDLGRLSEDQLTGYINLGYAEDEIRASGVQGYFSSKDYANFQNYQGRYLCSNIGKYFYVDAYALKISPKEALSTLVHEFQHMIHYYQKTLGKGNLHNQVVTSTWFNEMLSVLCEDALKEKINPNDTNGNGLVGRLQEFNKYYFTSGIEYSTDGNTSASYATLYTFGAYLLRTYGGMDLLKEMSVSGDADETAIVNAIKKQGHSTTINGNALTFTNLIREFCDDVLTGQSNSTKGLQRTEFLWSYATTEYKYPLKPLNLRDEKYDWENHLVRDASCKIVNFVSDNAFYNFIDNTTKFVRGPLLFRSGVKLSQLRPYGFIFYYLGKTTGETEISLDISEGAANQEIILVYAN
ncbi:MAG: hypothetical protein IJR49_06410 [Treponema sp.]|nr:hypothetical protein [Treponema sp.]